MSAAHGSEGSEYSSIVDRSQIEIVVENGIRSVAFADDGECIIGGDLNGKIRYWRVEDGKEMGILIDAEHTIWDIAVSQDGKWVVAGTLWTVMVWDAESRRKVVEFEAHDGLISAVAVSPDATKIATGSEDYAACVWSLLTGQQQLYWEHDLRTVHTIKFSPDGSLLATGSANSFSSDSSLRIYDCQNGSLLFNTRISSESLAWVSDSKQLLALSLDGNTHCLDVLSGTTLSTWPIHGNDKPRYISLASNDTFIAACGRSSVSFWETCTHENIGSFIRLPATSKFMAISAKYNLVIGGGEKIALWKLCNILPLPYVGDHNIHEAVSGAHCDKKFRFLCSQDEPPIDENLAQKPHGAAEQKNEGVMEALRSIPVDPRTEITSWEHEAERLHVLRVDFQLISKEEEDRLEETVRLLRADLRIQHTKSEKLEATIQQLLVTLHDAESSFQQLHAHLADSKQRVDAFTKVLRIHQQKDRCETLFADHHVIDAAMSFLQLVEFISEGERADETIITWLSDFRQRCTERLKKLADDAIGIQNYHEADEYYSVTLLIDPPDRMDILVKRSKVRAMMDSWEDALKDANEAVESNPSSYLGYQQRHAVLHGAGRYAEAVAAFDTMLSKLEESSDEHIHALRLLYTDARPAIRNVIKTTVSHLPHVLIDISTGQMLDKTEQEKAFEELPIFHDLVSSMTTHVDDERIEQEVKIFYRYVMLSHKWQPNEPRYKDVKNITVYKLQASLGNSKLKAFCSLVRSLGFQWAWCDTCCINQNDNSVLQEALVAMFAWYRGSSLTIVYLHDVPSKSLSESIWNTRAWTYQEYVAAETLRFYTKSWKPYLGSTLWNHKESPVVISEMERASQVSAERMAVILPGHERVREKLFLASMRRSTRVEDIAYSLLGIFNAPLVPTYGEGCRAVGRFLEYVLAASGDVTILAWTGTANDYHSCLPVNLSVYNSVVPPHIPRGETPDLTELCTSKSDLSLATTLYDRLDKLSLVSSVSTRMQLPCIRFPITKLVCPLSGHDLSHNRKYCAKTTALGVVEIQTTSQLVLSREHCLVHPWIRPLLDLDFSRGVAPDKATQALRLVARLRQPFGALLLEKWSSVVYRRVAADSLIMVQVCKGTPLTDLIDNIDMIYVK